MSKILKLEVSGFKRLRAVQITPTGDIVEITGKNGQGKSSVLDAIQAALGGTRRAPEAPVRKGHDRARIAVDMGSLKVERTFLKSGNAALVVTDESGEKLKSPQAVLDRLYGDLSFDPLSFAMAEPKKQVEILRSLSGIEATLAELDARRRTAMDARATAQAMAKRLETQIDALHDIGDGPTEPVDVVALTAEMTAAIEASGHILRGENWERSQVELVARLEQELDALQKRLAAAQGELERGRRILAEKRAAKHRDVTEIQAEVAQIHAENERRTQRRARAAAQAEWAKERDAIAKATRDIESIDADKVAALESVKFPVKGLAFDETGVRLNGQPFAQASTAEKIRASVAIGAAQAPELKVVLVREGSLLDSDSMKVLAEAADKAGLQIWVERVTDGDRVGVVIEDGEVAAVAPNSTQKAGGVA